MIRARVFVASLLSLSLLAIACGSSDPHVVNPGCATVCDQTAACLYAGKEGQQLCFNQCSSAAGNSAVAQHVVDECAACVSAIDCAGLVAGDCGARCPYDLFRGIGGRDAGATPPSDAGAPPTSDAGK